MYFYFLKSFLKSVILLLLKYILFELLKYCTEEQTGAKITRKMQTDKTGVMVQTQLTTKPPSYSAEVELKGN